MNTQGNNHTAILANRNYIDKQTEDRREAAIKAAATAGGDTKRLTMPLEERLRLAREAEAAKNAAKVRLSPKTVEEIAVMKIENLNARAARDLKRVLPADFKIGIPKAGKATPVPGEPHCAVGPVLAVRAHRGKEVREIQVFGGNVRGVVTINDKGEPTFDTSKIIPSTQETQNQGVFFALISGPGKDGKPQPSAIAAFRETDLDKVAASLCALMGRPEPKLKIANIRKAELEAIAGNNVSTPKPSKWADAKPETMTFAERRAAAAGGEASYAQDRRQVAGFGMR